MNVLRGEFPTKQKRLNDKYKKTLRSYINFQSASNVPSMQNFLQPLFAFTKVQNKQIQKASSPAVVSQTSSPFSSYDSDRSVTNEESTKEFSLSPRHNDERSSDLSQESNDETRNEDLSGYITSPKFAIRDMFQRSPDINGTTYNDTTDTSTEFRKLMMPFQNPRGSNSRNGSFDMEPNETDNASDAKSFFLEKESEANDDSIFKIPKPIFCTGKHNESTRSDASSDIRRLLQESLSSSKEQPEQDLMFDFESSRNDQQNLREAFNLQNGGRDIFQILQTPVSNKSSSSNRNASGISKTISTSGGTKTPSSRSRTGKSPKTPGSSRLTSDTDAGSFILAVTEGRGLARGEVGIAAMDPKRPHLILCQISDNQRYVQSLTKMNIFDFVEVIVPNTFVESSNPSKLYLDIRARFPTVTLTSVQRRHFSEAIGVELINQYCSPESSFVMVLLKDKFYALSAASALIKYVEFTQNVRLAPRSVKVEYQGTEDTMIIDLDTADRLELVMSVSHSETNLKNNLLGVVRYCHTKGGVRLLRANILQPPCSKAKIENRLNCVNELIDNPLLFYALESAVASFSNVESLLSLCMHAPQQEGIKVAEYQLKYSLLLKTMLELLPVLSSALEEAKTDYFCEVRENLRDARYQKILDRILETVFENSRTVKGSVASHLHGCFAVKPGVNGLLDIAKKTYCEIVQEISNHIDSLREKHNLPLKMSFSVNKGFHIQLTQLPGEKTLNETNFPKEFILIQKSRSTYSFYTSELVAMDQRSQQVLNEIKLMTNVILFELLNDIRQDIGCLFNLCEYIAELDVIVSFAHVGSGTNYVRPKFGNKLELRESRHPILDVIHDGKVVPNDVMAEKGKNFIILTGPNQSGKSIYIRQIALLQIMAQIGCYVPASEATFRITDRIFSRIGFDDSIESNASTLIVEMRDMEYIRQNITPNSIIIIDELCRGTSLEEGTSLAFAMCEELLDSSAFIFFTTHYLFLTKLEEMYFNVTNYNFETKIEETPGGKPSLQFTHKRMQGVTKAEKYGLRVAELTSFPSDVLLKAKQISEELLKERKPLPEVKGLVSRYELSLKMRNELSEHEEEINWEKMEPIIRRYKNLYLKLIDGSDVSVEDVEIPDEFLGSPRSVGKSADRDENDGPENGDEESPIARPRGDKKNSHAQTDDKSGKSSDKEEDGEPSIPRPEATNQIASHFDNETRNEDSQSTCIFEEFGENQEFLNVRSKNLQNNQDLEEENHASRSEMDEIEKLKTTTSPVDVRKVEPKQKKSNTYVRNETVRKIKKKARKVLIRKEAKNNNQKILRNENRKRKRDALNNEKTKESKVMKNDNKEK